MAQYKSDIVDVNLNAGSIHRNFLNHSIGQKDDDADRFGIRAFRDGVPQDLSGCSCHAWFTNSHGTTLALTTYGTVDGNEAYVTLPQACYDYDGQFCLAIKIVGGGISSTVRIIDGIVNNIDVGGAVSPTSELPDYSEILAQYDAMVDATAAATGAIAAAYSSSSTYKVGDYCIHNDSLYRCTTAITTAEAWTAAHWTAAKIGPDVSELKSVLIHELINANAFDVVQYCAKTSSSHNGVSFTWNAEGTQCTVVRESTGTSQASNRIWTASDGFPVGVVAGGIYHVKYSATNVSLQFYKNGGSSPFAETKKDTTITVPSDATGITIRLSVAASANANEVVNAPVITEALTNKGLENYIDTLLYHGKNSSYCTPIGYTFLSPSGAGHSSSNKMKPSDIPKNTYTYTTGQVLDSSGFPEGIEYSSSSHTYWVFRWSNTNSLTATANVCWYIVRHQQSGKMWFGSSTNGGTNVTWYKIESGVVNNYTTEYYENTYEITCSPTITTDTNNYLASTGDTTDRSGDIQTMLNTTGVCRLGPGDFYIESSISIPYDGSLIGNGNATKIICNFGSSDIPAIIMNGRSLLSDLFVSGSTSAITKDGVLTSKHGVYWAGTATGGETTSSTPKRGTISDVTFQRFTGGAITLANTGTNLDNCLNVVNVYITNCNAGINLVRYAEFNRFTNVHSQSNYFGAINNGGNNVFCNCTFSGDTCGMMMGKNDITDTTPDAKPNNSHGSIIGCIFDHSDNNNGYGLMAYNMDNAEMIQGCHFIFSKIHIEDSIGFMFTGCLFGYGSGDPYGAHIEVTANANKEASLFLSSCLFKKTPEITITGTGATAIKNNCYLLNGTPVT